MERRECETRYELAAAILPSRLRRIAMELPETDKRRAEEFRLRAGHCLSVLLPEGERSLEAIVTTEELETLCDIAAEFSRYASIETLRQGFLPVRGGFRVGLCGSAVVKDGEVTNLKQISSAVIRISREQKGIAQAVAPRLFRDGRFVSTLLLSPPGGGKTTLLRDLVRQLSQGEGVPPQRITLIDEREEIAVMYRGQPQMDVGPRTDVLSGCPKALAIPMALRAMNPQIIAVDEITVREDRRGAAGHHPRRQRGGVTGQALVSGTAGRAGVPSGGADPNRSGGAAVRRGESAVIKLVGSLCVLFAGGSVWWLQHQEQRRRRQVLAELAAALDYMETSIRLNRTPLLPLFRQAARGRCHEVSQLFERSAAALAAGRSPEIVWCQTVSCLPVSETDKRALSELVNTLQGDETSACKGILLARKELQNSLSQLEKQRPEEEKRTAALCFSTAALLVILLI